ncbi:MAG: hypothetical protein ACR2OG_06240 [Gemmatimonadaceae bacterium]
MIGRVAIALVLMVATTVRTQARPPQVARSHAAAMPATAMRNPVFLRALELLTRTTVGVAPRIRFEWEQVPGCTTYLLVGKWTGAQSWAVSSREYRVTAANASSWKSDQVTFDVSLPEGSHSWKVVSVFGPADTGDFTTPTQLSFDLR